MLTVFIDEEYGYMMHRWLYPGTKKELINDFRKGRIPVHVFNSTTHPEQAQGTCERYHGRMSEFGHHDALMHIHEAEDSFLRLVTIESDGVKSWNKTWHWELPVQGPEQGEQP